LPGLANAHSHAFHRALRGRTHRGSGSFWTWREQMYDLATCLDPDRYHALARAAYGEMVLAGFTSVGEFHYLHHGPGGVPYANANAMAGALTAAAADAGLRLTLLDTCYLRGGLDPGGREVSLNEVQQRFADADVDAWAERADALRSSESVRVGAAIHSVRACRPPEMAVVARWASAHAAPLHAHVSEQPGENVACLAAHGATPTAVLGAAGALDARFTAVHATHLTGNDIELLGRSSCTACFCPTTERDLADGIGPASALVAAGARLAIGSDSHAVIDGFEETRAIELDERLASNRRGTIGVATLLSAATANGHDAIGWHDAGRLAPGARADLVTVSMASVRLAGTTARDALASVVFAATAADVTHVVVDGREVVSDGRHRTIDVRAELTAALA
jgi:formiminoglutamate deiminase